MPAGEFFQLCKRRSPSVKSAVFFFRLFRVNKCLKIREKVVFVAIEQEIVISGLHVELTARADGFGEHFCLFIVIAFEFGFRARVNMQPEMFPARRLAGIRMRNRRIKIKIKTELVIPYFLFA